MVSHLLPDRRGLREWLAGISDAPPQFGGPSMGDLQKALRCRRSRRTIRKGATLPPFQAYDPSKGATLPAFKVPSVSDVEKGATLPPFQAYDPSKGATLPAFKAMSPAPAAPPPLPGEAQQAAKRGADDDFLRLFQVPEPGKGRCRLPVRQPRRRRWEKRGKWANLQACSHSSPIAPPNRLNRRWNRASSRRTFWRR